jgi:MFS family permease
VTFYRCPSETAPLYLVPFAIANFLGALLLGRFFDTIGRRAMIAGTYFISAVGLVAAGVLFKNDSVSVGRVRGDPVRDVLLRVRERRPPAT